MTKTYMLELTAEELAGGGITLVWRKLNALRMEAAADREAADELRLPWRAIRMGGGDTVPAVVREDGIFACSSHRAAKLMAAAPELLEAVKAADEALNCSDEACCCHGDVRPAIARALRKVATGEVEP